MKGSIVTVGIATEAEFTKGNSHAKIAELKTGDRVVIHAKKEGNKPVAFCHYTSAAQSQLVSPRG
jgi:hypothetical protein